MKITRALYASAAVLTALSLMYAQDTGTPQPTDSSVAVAPNAPTSTPNPNGPRVGVLAYCTDLSGIFGASNAVNTLNADGRFGPVTLVNASSTLPTAAQLLSSYDCVVAMTDNRCGGVSDSTPLAGFVAGGGGVALATFGYSTFIGFTAPIFASGLSPFQPVQGPNAAAGAIDVAGASTAAACSGLMTGVTSPVSSTFANAVTLSSGATLCASYTNGQGLLSVNPTASIVGVNTFPADQLDNGQASYGHLISNATYKACTHCTPTISSVSTNPFVLWPPNHKFVNVAVNYSVSSPCATSCSLSVTSNEPVNGTGDGNTSPDWHVLDSHDVALRAERSGDGTGRSYTIKITCSAGPSSSSATAIVTVPHDQGQ